MTKLDIDDAASHCMELDDCGGCPFDDEGITYCVHSFIKAYRAKCAEVEELRKALEYVEPWISGFICQCDDDVGKVCDRCTLANVINDALEGKE